VSDGELVHGGEESEEMERKNSMLYVFIRQQGEQKRATTMDHDDNDNGNNQA